MTVYVSLRLPLIIQMSAIEQRWPKCNFQSTPEESGWITRMACLEGCLTCTTSCDYPPALASAIAGNQPCCGSWVILNHCTACFDSMRHIIISYLVQSTNHLMRFLAPLALALGKTPRSETREHVNPRRHLFLCCGTVRTRGP